MSITLRGTAAACLLVFALAAASGDPGAGEIRRERRVEGVVLAVSQAALERGSSETSFNFAHVRDLWVRVWLAGKAEPVQLNLRLIDPQGALVYEASVPYAPDVPVTGPPVAAFKARSQDGWVALDYALPVSGSVVTRSLSDGSWTLVAEAGGRTFSTSIDISAAY